MIEAISMQKTKERTICAWLLVTLCKANVQVTAVHWASKSVVLAAVVGSLTARVTASLANYLQFTTKVTLELHCPPSEGWVSTHR